MDQFIAHIEEMLEVDSGTLTPESNIKDRPEWTSLTFMGLIAMVDEEYGVMLRPAAVLKTQSIRELAELVSPDLAFNRAA